MSTDGCKTVSHLQFIDDLGIGDMEYKAYISVLLSKD